LIDGRNLPEQFIAAGLLAAELESRGYECVILSDSWRDKEAALGWQRHIAEGLGLEASLRTLGDYPITLRAGLRITSGFVRGMLRSYTPGRGGLLDRLINGFRYRGVEVGDLIFDSHVKRGFVLAPARHPLALAAQMLFALRRLEAIGEAGRRAKFFGHSTTVYVTTAALIGRAACRRADEECVSLDFARSSLGRTRAHHSSPRATFVLKSVNDVAMQRRAKTAFLERLEGRTANKDARVAYRSTERFDLDAVRTSGAGATRKPAMLVAAHSLTDAVHSSGHLVFRDYVDWVRKTLRWARRNGGAVDWVVKEHPYAPIYREVGILEKIVKDSGLKGVAFVGHDVNTRSVLDQVAVVVTARGTIAIEAVARGMPVVIAGNTPYSDLELANVPTDRADYFGQLADACAGRLSPPAEDVRIRALMALLFEESKSDRGLASGLGLPELDQLGKYNKDAYSSVVADLLEDPAGFRQRIWASEYRKELLGALDHLGVGPA